ncbi:MAG: class I SAM-dependent methyltransferase [Proteobacteria bacterium]|nr:class I SAM-dependent methyltransferase [Pseudomonadota bacterium]
MKKTTNRWNADGYTATYRAAVSTIDTMIKPHILSKIDIKRGATVLECGIGSGKWSAGFALLGYHVYAMDNLEAMVQRAYDNFPNIQFQGIVKDIRDPPLMDHPVDLIFNEGVIEHFLDDDERKGVLTNFYNAVRGYVSIIVPYKSEEEDEIFYTKKKLRDELKDVGFSILNTYEIIFLSNDQVTTRILIGVNANKK